MIALTKHHTDYYVEDILAALVRVADDDGNPLFKTVKFLSETSVEVEHGFLSPTTEQCPCAILVYESPDDTLIPGVQGFEAEIYVRCSVYIVHSAFQSDVAPKLMLDRIMLRMWDYLDEVTDDNPNGIVPTSIGTAGTLPRHWEFKTNELRRPQYADVSEIRSERTSISLISGTEQMWGRRVMLAPVQIVVQRPLS